jgi:glycyl-tRNA synthetase beta chain
LKQFRGKPQFTKLVIGQKRVRNILKDIKKKGNVKTEFFKQPAEKKLYERGHGVASNLKVMLERGAYTEVLKILLGLREVIDKFFDDVMVMCDEKTLRNNRLALVSYINNLFMQFADFSKIVIEGGKQ